MSDTQPAKSPSAGWSDWANRTTAVLAVLAALSSGQWGASNLQAILEQGKVNDTWAYYQADSIKEHGAKQMKDLVEVLGHGDLRTQAMFTDLQKKFSDEAVDKEKNKQDQKSVALSYEATRDKMVERSFWFEISFAAIQLGVVLCTVAAAAKSKGLWIAAISFGVLGLAVLVNGIHPFAPAPKAWYESATKQMSYDGTAQDGAE